jgi:hypothetical protein
MFYNTAMSGIPETILQIQRFIDKDSFSRINVQTECQPFKYRVEFVAIAFCYNRTERRGTWMRSQKYSMIFV